MGFHRGPHIITDGLVIALDAGNTKSYPGSGTLWTDKSGFGVNATLINGPTFNSGNGGSIVFDGTNDFCSSSINTIPSGNSSKSMFVWFKTNSPSTRQTLVYTGTESANGRFFVEIQDSKFKFNYFNSAIGTYTLNSNTWYYGGVTYNSVTSTINLYVNGILTDTTVVALTTGVTNVINIGSVLSTFYLNGNISQISAYNRALTAQEIQQNYNATKSRFGL